MRRGAPLRRVLRALPLPVVPAVLAALAPALSLPGADAGPLHAQPLPDPVVVASKPFAESLILAEAFAQLLESRGVAVDRRPGLGSTEITFQALRADEVDVYPEYTGTGLLVLLNRPAGAGAARVWQDVATAFRERWGVRWLAPLGFENTYAIAVRRATADSLGLSTLSDLAAVSRDLVAGFTPDFMGREDGLPGLEGAYGAEFGSVRPLLQAVKYRALSEGAVDVIDGYSTDGALAGGELVVLEDDRGFFPPYEAAPVVSRRLAEGRPEVLDILGAMAGRIGVEEMRRANRRAEVEGVPVAQAARDLLVEAGLLSPGPSAPVPGGEAEGPGGAARAPGAPPAPVLEGDAGAGGEGGAGGVDWREIRRGAGTLLVLTGEHLFLVALSLLGALLLAIPLGLALSGGSRAAEPVLRGVGVLQTIPSIALLAFMIPLLGVGVLPAVAALFLYSLLPVLRNTVTGLDDADPDAAEAGRALGMTPRQVLTQVRLPLAAPVIMAGVRTAAVINVGTATLAAFIGAGGLGEPIVAGLALSDNGLILSGAIPAAALALVVDGALAAVERRVSPRGLETPGR